MFDSSGLSGYERIKGFEGYHQLVEWPVWSPEGKSIVFSLAEKAGDVFVLSASRSAR